MNCTKVFAGFCRMIVFSLIKQLKQHQKHNPYNMNSNIEFT